MEPKIRTEKVVALRPYIAEEDMEAFQEECRQINEIDARDGTNDILDAVADEMEPDPDYS
ncbi:MAG: hypothetical protein OXR62_15920 [Ahrensia sp.]|nr:hypothetical protein [Ahrensia sp.]